MNTTLWPGFSDRIIEHGGKILADVSIYQFVALPDGALVGEVQAWRDSALLAIKFANGDIIAHDHDGDDTYSFINGNGSELIKWNTFKSVEEMLL